MAIFHTQWQAKGRNKVGGWAPTSPIIHVFLTWVIELPIITIYYNWLYPIIEGTLKVHVMLSNLPENIGCIVLVWFAMTLPLDPKTMKNEGFNP